MQNHEKPSRNVSKTHQVTFYPNECFICRSRKDLRRCSKCQMITYCGDDHQKRHWDQHKDFCKLVSDILKKKKISHLYEDLRGVNENRWKQEREKAQQEIGGKLSRPLEFYELEMLLYPRACFVCHESKQHILTNCPTCPSVSFCPEHKDLRRHVFDCTSLSICHDLDIKFTEEKYKEVLVATWCIIDTIFFFDPKTQNQPKSMKQLLLHYLKPPVIVDDDIKVCASELLTVPLTLFNAMQKIKLPPTPRLVVHVIGVGANNCIDKFWESVLHLMPHLKFLKVVVIIEEKQSKMTKLCDNCLSNNKQIEIETISGKEYGHKVRNLEKPSIFILQNFGNLECDKKAMSALNNLFKIWRFFSSPFVLITDTELKLKKMKDIVKASFPRHMIYYDGSNEFASMRPRRDWESGGVFRENQFTIIFKNLNPENEENGKTSTVNNKVEQKPHSVLNETEKSINSVRASAQGKSDSDKSLEKKTEKPPNSVQNKIEQNSDSNKNKVEETEKFIEENTEKESNSSEVKIKSVEEKAGSKEDDRGEPSNSIQENIGTKSDLNENKIEKSSETLSVEAKKSVEPADDVTEKKSSDSEENKFSSLDDKILNWNFFNFNGCQVCHTQGHCIPCTRCKMISYCDEEHRKEHWPEHKDLCQVILRMLREVGGTTIFDKSKPKDMDSWVKVKIDLMLKAQTKLGRQLVDYERQMFLFPRSCFVCHEYNMSVLKTCDCGVSLCKEHRKNPVHSSLCPDFLMFSRLAAALQIVRQRYPLSKNLIDGMTESSIVAIPHKKEYKRLPSSIKSFISSYIKISKKQTKLNEVLVPVVSEYLSRPLTTLYAIQRLELTSVSSLNIHVIGATTEEFSFSEYWEVLLHWLPNLKRIEITFIGPEMKGNSVTMISSNCKTCRSDKKSSLSHMKVLQYNEFFESKSFSKPDIIVGFNLDLHESEYGISECTWKESILTLTKIDAPFIMTAGTEIRAKKDHKRLCDLLERSVPYNFCEQNPFASLIIERDFETEEFKYGNKYIVIYKELYKSVMPEKPEEERIQEVIQVPKNEKKLVVDQVKGDKKKSDPSEAESSIVKLKIEDGHQKVADSKIKVESFTAVTRTTGEVEALFVAENPEKETRKQPEKAESENESLDEYSLLEKENELLEENLRLIEENDKLKNINQKLKQENERLRSENALIKDLRSQVHETIRSSVIKKK